MGQLADRRFQTAERVKQLQAALADAEKRASGKACVYATGSFGRGEASKFSDLDLFIVGKNDGKPGPSGKQGSLLKRLDDICLRADLIEATRKLGIQEFSGDGEYLVHYSVDHFTKTLGTREDDFINTFTGRVLLLLESSPLLEQAVYEDIIEDVISAYWRDYEDHKSDFIPAFLANDILRLWRTFCVNYEAGTEREPDEKKAKGKLKNYKLKHSRLLTCYSALLYLLAFYGSKGTVSPEDALSMIRLTPTQRLEWLISRPELVDAHATLARLLEKYEKFLERTNADEKDLIVRLKDKTVVREFSESAYEFGDLMFDALKHIGSVGTNQRFYRLLIV